MMHSREQCGFTLVEMLVSISIFAVITAFTTANFRLARQGDEIRLASQLVGSAMRRAQTSAAAGETVWLCHGGANDLKMCLNGDAALCPSGTCAQEVPSGYGIHVATVSPDSRKIVLFADLNNDKAYTLGEAVRSDNVSPGPFVSVSAVSPVASNALDVVFQPPKPTGYFNGSTAQATATVTLTHSTTGAQKTVTVNRISGQISAD